MSQHFPKTGAAIHGCFKWVSSGVDNLLEYEEMFKECLYRWLDGSGHVDHPQVNALVPENVRRADAQDRGLRARRFLRYLTGLDSIPREGSVQVMCDPLFSDYL
jgi:hypothetical protein